MVLVTLPQANSQQSTKTIQITPSNFISIYTANKWQKKYYATKNTQYLIPLHGWFCCLAYQEDHQNLWGRFSLFIFIYIYISVRYHSGQSVKSTTFLRRNTKITIHLALLYSCWSILRLCYECAPFTFVWFKPQ